MTASSGIRLHMTKMATGQRPSGLVSEGAPSRIRTCAHGSGDHGPLGDGTHCELRKRTAWASSLSRFSRGRRERGSAADAMSQVGIAMRRSGRACCLLILSS